LIFFDTEHATDHLANELEIACRSFPEARFYGDDWGWPRIRVAVRDYARSHGLASATRGIAWSLGPRPPSRLAACILARRCREVAPERRGERPEPNRCSPRHGRRPDRRRHARLRQRHRRPQLHVPHLHHRRRLRLSGAYNLSKDRAEADWTLLLDADETIDVAQAVKLRIICALGDAGGSTASAFPAATGSTWRGRGRRTSGPITSGDS
jgi:hypothetical protein